MALDDTGDSSVEAAIAEAKLAARNAGLSAEPAAGETTHGTGPGDHFDWTSFALEIEEIRSAAHIADIEHALTQVAGVRASVIYATNTAWISAPDSVDPNLLIEKLDDIGVTAWLTRSSLRRRAERLQSATRRNRLSYHRGASWKLRSLGIKGIGGRDSGERTDATREEGILRTDVRLMPKEKEPTDVLFTARALVTRTRLVVSVLLTIPVLVMAYDRSAQFDYWQWVSLALATPVVLWGAWPFHRAAVAGLRRGMSALDAASSVAIIVSYLWSIILLTSTPAGEVGWKSSPEWFAVQHSVFASGELFLDVACGCTVLLLFGRLLTRFSASSLLDDKRWPEVDPHDEVQVVRKDPDTKKMTSTAIAVQEIRVGDDITVDDGHTIPSDGRVIGGSAKVHPGLVGGGNMTVDVKVNSTVTAGSVVEGGPLKIRVANTGSRTKLAAIRRWLVESSRYGNRSAQLATRSASLLVPWAISLSMVDFILWWLIGGNLNSAFATALAVLCCVGPVALALSTSIAMRLGVEAGVRRGVLVRDAETIRELNEITTVVFNRVGTLAAGEMSVETITAEVGENPELVLRVAGALAMESDHPASRALVKAAREARDAGTGGEDIPHWIEASDVHFDGQGDFVGRVEIPVATADGSTEMKFVDARLWRPKDLSQLHGRIASATVAGGTPLVVSWKGTVRGVITLYDRVKDDAQDAVGELESLGYETVMLTRDTYPVARRFADNLGISKVLAGISPDKKASAVRSVHAAGEKVCFVGDPSVLGCLRVADVGVLMDGDDRIDVPEADVVILRREVQSVTELLVLSRRVSAVVDRNIAISWVYNGVAIAASCAGVLHPMAATVAMIASSMIIEARSNRVRNF
ncbi:heavy metal translocating P-type ATPase [Corynebacterium mendelii]|uniref:Cation-translocating P-type ATPase n=1 Tax=Corynebacterium mendelii TaxID=2765362 RepID=A0A939DZ25_9CORY|nr:HAD-IC family P-type ATPase [Corynebacterium mendelii]MBN9643884.1 cation-translocating P-type ATPase [Corynebacterium mendelii]